MAASTSKKIIIAILLLCAAAGINRLIIYNRHPVGNRGLSPLPLGKAFEKLPGWQSQRAISLDSTIVQTLNLDDYLFSEFGRQDQSISLYIGFYRQAAKVGASHDPLVCFQGQGWQIGSRRKGRHTVSSGHQAFDVNYSMMIAQRQDQQELLIYWFQTASKTADNTFRQKIDMVRQRLMGGSEDNAFVRISMPLSPSISENVAREQIIEFIDAFYPRFLAFLSPDEGN